MKPEEQYEVSIGVLKNLETLAVNAPDSHRVLLREVVAQAGQLNEHAYISVICPVLADILKAVEMGQWICRMREQIGAGQNGTALETLRELEEWLSRLWHVADPFSDRTEPPPAGPVTKAGRRRKGLNSADIQFLRLLGVSAGSERDETKLDGRRK
jgi:hypothetical protein